MPKLLKKKKKQKKSIDKKVYMPQRNNSSKNIKKRKKKFSIKKNKNIKRRKKLKFSTLIFYIIIPLLLVSLLYVSVTSVIRIRNRVGEEEMELHYVMGIEDVPVFPNSEFIFTNNIEEMSVASFISSGNSAYRLPTNRSILNVFAYYEEKLPEYGWVHVLSVPVGSEEMKSGEYWIKDGRGLRIYSKFNDVWYEMITGVQAYTGLKDRVEREIERDLLLASEDSQDLLPDFEWSLEVPREYVISYGTSNFDNLRLVEFRRLGSDEKIIITPIGRMGQVLDNYLSEYIDILNQRSEEFNWTITNTTLTYTNYGRALRGTISSGGVTHDVAIVPNKYNNVIYVIDSNRTEDPFFDFVYSNLTPQGLEED